MLKITTLGSLSITIDDAPVESFVSRKADALLVYLALNPGEHPREMLSDLLWDDLSQSQALSYLRTALASLQKQLAPYLLATRYSIAINPESEVWVDALELDRVLTTARGHWDSRQRLPRAVADTLESALSLYKGDFLAGFNLRNSTGFEDWLRSEQERLRARVIEAHQRLGEHHLHERAYSAGIEHTACALQLDPLREDAHRQMMRLLAESGQRNAALAHYETCARVLREELGVEPDEETRRLHDQILAGLIAPGEAAAIPNNLPTMGTQFVDRPTSLVQILSQLGKPDCRLLTLVGPGGIGKTRLAIEAARQLLPDFPDGVYFVSFAGVQNPRLVLETIAHTLDARFQGDFSNERDVIAFLRDKAILFVLDNFESVLPNAEILSHLLHATSAVKMLVTSRERLRLTDEWLFVVEALRVPGPDDDAPETFPAVQLFAQTALRMKPDFSITADLDTVIDILHAVGGMPLAIELAASWVRMMSTEEILREIQRSVDFLTAPLRNVPERHASLRAVFDSSWRLLSDDERRAFRQLAVFQGGFTHQAAEAITDNTLFTLSSLVDKSLLQPVNHRYEIHALLWHFAREKLDEHPDERERVHAAHSAYYTAFLEEHERHLGRTLADSAFELVIREVENIRAAWTYALEKGNEAAIDRFLRPAFRLYDAQSNFHDAEALLGSAAERLAALSPDGNSLPLARARVLQGACNFRMDRYEPAERLIRMALPVLQAHNATWELGLGLLMLGNTAGARGDYHQARAYFADAAERLRESGETAAYTRVLFRLASNATMLGDYDLSRRYLDQGLQALGDNPSKQSRMHSLIVQGDLNVRVGRYAEAKEDFETALAISAELGSRNNYAMILADLAQALIALGDYEQAVTLCRQSIEQNDEVHNRWGIAYGLLYLGKAYLGLGDLHAAAESFARGIAVSEDIGADTTLSATLSQQGRAYLRLGDMTAADISLRRALRIASDKRIPPLALDALAGLAALRQSQQPDEAAMLAAYVVHQPAATFETCQEMRGLLQAQRIDEGAPVGADVADEGRVQRLLERFLAGAPDQPPA